MRGAGTRFKPSDPSLGLLASDLIVLSLGSPRAELPGSPCALLPSPHLPLATGQPRPALVSCSNGSSDPYCIVKVDNEPIIRYAPPPNQHLLLPTLPAHIPVGEGTAPRASDPQAGPLP